MIKLAITDDQVIILNGLQKILADAKNISITGVYNSGDELLEGIAKVQPDVLLLDIQMPGKSGIELAAVRPIALLRKHVARDSLLDVVGLGGKDFE